MPAMKVQKQTQKVVSACLLKFVLVHVCVCLGHACNLKRRLFEEAAQRWKHGCSMVFQSLLATQPSILPWFAQQQVDASSAFIDIA